VKVLAAKPPEGVTGLVGCTALGRREPASGSAIPALNDRACADSSSVSNAGAPSGADTLGISATIGSGPGSRGSERCSVIEAVLELGGVERRV
jgi:hypothetical protein